MSICEDEKELKAHPMKLEAIMFVVEGKKLNADV